MDKEKQYYKKEVFSHPGMQLFRKKFLAMLVAGATLLALLNISVQLATIFQLFPGMNLSYVLAEEVIETSTDCSQKEVDSTIDLIFARTEYMLHYREQANSVTSFFHRIKLPAYPCFEMIIPPPEG